MSQPPHVSDSSHPFQDHGCLEGTVPPPPPLGSLIPVNWNARNKKFHFDDQQQEREYQVPCGHKKRIQIQPYLHYNLNRNFTIMTYLDEFNELTKCPTLISFGGPHVRDKTIYYLELDPPKTRVDLEDDMYRVEYEWKELQTIENNHGELFKYHVLQIQNGCIVYSKKLQRLIVFECGDYNYLRFYFLCLKNRSWIKKKFQVPSWSYSWDYLLTKYDEEGTKGLLMTRSFMTVAIVDFEELLSSNDLQLIEKTSLTIDVKHVTFVSARMIVPLSIQQQLLIVGAKEESQVHTIDLNNKSNTTTGIHEGLQIFNHLHHAASAYPLELSTSSLTGEQVLITLVGEQKEHLFFEYNTQTQMSTVLLHNSLPIKLEHHALFSPFLCTYRNRRNERCAVYLPNLDILYKIKLDYDKPECAFPYLKRQLLSPKNSNIMDMIFIFK
ncbi:hypothetical protein FDP41_006618 [Naegleria fowleri]|uniref:Uncharacterized protein n=1 Tax=Naegleria fowleri TaxID=5763 RepID=A0A6A5BIH0_NAEFO|nr:uncharacterized protein FDP41_006618 [Naegleria fowleri]KAF0974586.1 hypothetical protein FDP41_006618 [Naegleria fowleri]CAG4718714.1 unnamed protein product [Naegleria fowleri]